MSSRNSLPHLTSKLYGKHHQKLRSTSSFWRSSRGVCGKTGSVGSPPIDSLSSTTKNQRANKVDSRSVPPTPLSRSVAQAPPPHAPHACLHAVADAQLRSAPLRARAAFHASARIACHGSLLRVSDHWDAQPTSYTSGCGLRGAATGPTTWQCAGAAGGARRMEHTV